MGENTEVNPVAAERVRRWLEQEEQHKKLPEEQGPYRDALVRRDGPGVSDSGESAPGAEHQPEQQPAPSQRQLAKVPSQLERLQSLKQAQQEQDSRKPYQPVRLEYEPAKPGQRRLTHQSSHQLLPLAPNLLQPGTDGELPQQPGHRVLQVSTSMLTHAPAGATFSPQPSFARRASTDNGDFTSQAGSGPSTNYHHHHRTSVEGRPPIASDQHKQSYSNLSSHQASYSPAEHHGSSMGVAPGHRSLPLHQHQRHTSSEGTHAIAPLPPRPSPREGAHSSPMPSRRPSGNGYVSSDEDRGSNQAAPHRHSPNHHSGHPPLPPGQHASPLCTRHPSPGVSPAPPSLPPRPAGSSPHHWHRGRPRSLAGSFVTSSTAPLLDHGGVRQGQGQGQAVGDETLARAGRPHGLSVRRSSSEQRRSQLIDEATHGAAQLRTHYQRLRDAAAAAACRQRSDGGAPAASGETDEWREMERMLEDLEKKDLPARHVSSNRQLPTILRQPSTSSHRVSAPNLTVRFADEGRETPEGGARGGMGTRGSSISSVGAGGPMATTRVSWQGQPERGIELPIVGRASMPGLPTTAHTHGEMGSRSWRQRLAAGAASDAAGGSAKAASEHDQGMSPGSPSQPDSRRRLQRALTNPSQRCSEGMDSPVLHDSPLAHAQHAALPGELLEDAGNGAAGAGSPAPTAQGQGPPGAVPTDWRRVALMRPPLSRGGTPTRGPRMRHSESSGLVLQPSVSSPAHSRVAQHVANVGSPGAGGYGSSGHSSFNASPHTAQVHVGTLPVHHDGALGRERWAMLSSHGPGGGHAGDPASPGPPGGYEGAAALDQRLMYDKFRAASDSNMQVPHIRTLPVHSMGGVGGAGGVGAAGGSFVSGGSGAGSSPGGGFTTRMSTNGTPSPVFQSHTASPVDGGPGGGMLASERSRLAVVSGAPGGLPGGGMAGPCVGSTGVPSPGLNVGSLHTAGSRWKALGQALNRGSVLPEPPAGGQQQQQGSTGGAASQSQTGGAASQSQGLGGGPGTYKRVSVSGATPAPPSLLRFSSLKNF